MFKNIKNVKKENVDFLENSIRNHNLKHAYFFYGPGIKYAEGLILEWIKSILCNNGKEENCQCSSCRKFSKISCFKDGNIHPDFLGTNLLWNNKEKPKKAMSEVRKLILNFSLTPNISRKKVVIIRYFDYVSLDIANTLLKSLEEPPKKTIIILLGSNEQNILSTVSSRTINLYFGLEKDIINKDFKDFLQKKYLIDKFKYIEKVLQNKEEESFLKYLISDLKKVLYKEKNINNRNEIIKKIRRLFKIQEQIKHTNCNKKLALENAVVNF